MNIFKIGLLLLTGAGVGFGVDTLADTEMFSGDDNNYYEYMDERYCHNDGDFLEHILEDLTVEEQVLVQEKIDQLLVEYSITLETLNDDNNVRYNFMTDLMVFLDENEIDYHAYRGFNHHTDGDEWYGGMGMH